MKSILRYLALGFIAYLLFVVFTFPAVHVSRMLQDKVPGLVLGNVSGTVFTGQSAQASWQDIDLGQLQWRFRPLSLFKLRLEYALQFAADVNRGSGNAGMGFGSMYANNMRLQLESALLINRFAVIPMQTGGVIDLQIDELTHDGKSVLSVAGTIDWKNASIESPASLQLGHIGMTVEQRDDNIVGSVVRGGSLGIAGDITLGAGRSYAVDLSLRPDASIPADAIGVLETFAQQQPDGSLGLKLAGNY